MLSLNSSKNRIVIELVPDDFDTVELRLKAYREDFSLSGSAYFSIAQIRRNLEKFSRYPLHENDLPRISGGYFNDDGSVLEVELVSISVFTVGMLGNLVMRVSAFQEYFDHEQKDIGNFARIDFILNYENIASFVSNMRNLLDDPSKTLEFDEFSC